jgi:hypothetical protein
MGDVRDLLFEDLAGFVEAIAVDNGSAVVGEQIRRGREVVFAIALVNLDA